MDATRRDRSFQSLILGLQAYWAERGCVILQPYDMEVGAGTFHPATTLRSLGPEPWRAAYVQPSRRPGDGRYGENPNRLQHYYQFQVILKPAPEDVQDQYLGSLGTLGIDVHAHDIRFVEDDWESPTLGAWGLGWEIWCDGMEVTQFTYFQQVGASTATRCRSSSPTAWSASPCTSRASTTSTTSTGTGTAPATATCSCGPSASSRPSISSTRMSSACAATSTMRKPSAPPCSRAEPPLTLPAYDQCMKASHLFNLLDARGAISVVERAAYIGRVRALAKACCEAWLAGAA